MLQVVFNVRVIATSNDTVLVDGIHFSAEHWVQPPNTCRPATRFAADTT